MKQAERRITHYLQNMRMTADEQLGMEAADSLPCAPVVIARIPADVRHVDGDTLAIPDELLGKISTQFRTVNIPVYAPEQPESPEPIENVDSPEVARVPDLIAIGEMPEHGVVQKSVRVGEQSDSHSSAYAHAGHRVAGNETAPR